jgi:hypothetical protein
MRFLAFAPKFTVVVILSAFTDPDVLSAADFRVDSKVFVGKETVAHTTNVTLFHGEHVYDFLDRPLQITIYDLHRGRIVLLDPKRRFKAEVTDQMLDSFCESLRRAEHKTQDELLKFALRPTFDERSGQESGERIFSAEFLSYRVKLYEHNVKGMASQYRAFSDASARLNALANHGSLPPFPRLVVNAALDDTGNVPAQIELRIVPRELGAKTVVLRSQHEFRPRLLDSDLRKIDEAGAQLASATLVRLGEYLRPVESPQE